MSTMPTNEEMAAFLIQRLEAEMDRVRDVTVPVFVERQTPEAIGSAVLVKMGDEHFVVTAGHVTDWVRLGKLYLGGGVNPILLEGILTTTIPPSGNRDLDKLDVSVVRLEANTVAALQDKNFLRRDELYGGLKVPQGDYCLVAGYPCTKQNVRFNPPSVETSTYNFIAVSRDAREYEVQNYDQQRNLLLKFSKKKMWNRSKGRVIAPDLNGMSGCGIWYVEGYAAAELKTPRLAAIGIEWHTTKRPQVLGTRVAVVLAAIARKRPHLLEYVL